MLWDLLCQPFVEFDFMRHALLGIVCMALGTAPLGVLLQLRRMSLMGDAIGHAVLPGVVLGYLLAGQNIWAMGAGGLLAGLAMALGVGLASRQSPVREESHLTAFYLACLALGVAAVSRYGSQTDLLHLLFGSVLAIDGSTLTLLGGVAGITLLLLGVFRHTFLAQAIDPVFSPRAAGAAPCGTLFF